MKLSLLCSAALLGAVTAFAPSLHTGRGATCLAATTNRRNFVQTTVAIGSATATTLVLPTAAFAKEYVPKFDDVKIILVLGMSLDRLIAKMEDPDKIGAALENLGTFNRDPDFYPGYAKNFISKTVKKRADEDVRVGYMKQACKLIGSTEELLASAAVDKSAATEAIDRVKKAQQLIAKFLAESGVEDENVAKFVAEHKS